MWTHDEPRTSPSGSAQVQAAVSFVAAMPARRFAFEPADGDQSHTKEDRVGDEDDGSSLRKQCNRATNEHRNEDDHDDPPLP